MPDSVLVGLIGAGIQQSLSPKMHEQEGAAQQLAYVYKLIDLDELGLSGDILSDLLLAAERLGFGGLNITYPCKQAVVPLLHELSADARDVGAVNTVLFCGGSRIGHNTDCWGFAEAFRRELGSERLDRVVLFGAGGAGSAVAHALLLLGVRQLAIVDTDAAKATGLVKNLQMRFGQERASSAAEDAIGLADGVVNATPIGMARHPGAALDLSRIRPSQWVADIVYPIETLLLRHARSLGCRTMSGGGMAVFQAVKAFELFSGRTADAGRMQRHFRQLCDGTA